MDSTVLENGSVTDNCGDGEESLGVGKEKKRKKKKLFELEL